MNQQHPISVLPIGITISPHVATGTENGMGTVWRAMCSVHEDRGVSSLENYQMSWIPQFRRRPEPKEGPSRELTRTSLVTRQSMTGTSETTTSYDDVGEANPSIRISSTSSNSVAIAVYAVPLFKEGSRVRFAYIPVAGGEQRIRLSSNAAGEKVETDGASQSPCFALESSVSASALTAALRASRPVSSASSAHTQPPLVASLQGAASRTASHAKSTWDGWGRLEKGTWLRWLHDMGQSVTEDVSAEARLARGISARATRVTVWHPECVSQEEAHQQIAAIVQVTQKAIIFF
jgi:hypothetical protein